SLGRWPEGGARLSRLGFGPPAVPPLGYVRRFGGGGRRCRFFGRNDRQPEVGPPTGAEVQAGHAAEDVERTVARIVVEEGTASCELVLEVRELAAARAGMDVVLSADGETDAVTGRHNDGSRPDLDIELD